MSRSRRCLTSGLVALTVGLVGGVLLPATALASPVTSAGTVFKSVQCPNGYALNPQDTQQCTPKSSPTDGSLAIPPGSESGPHPG
jgi:hypothetical protein